MVSGPEPGPPPRQDLEPQLAAAGTTKRVLEQVGVAMLQPFLREGVWGPKRDRVVRESERFRLLEPRPRRGGCESCLHIIYTALPHGVHISRRYRCARHGVGHGPSPSAFAAPSTGSSTSVETSPERKSAARRPRSKRHTIPLSEPLVNGRRRSGAKGLIPCMFPASKIAWTPHEEDVPTAQSAPATAPWLPEAHAHARGSRGHPPPPGSWPRSFGRLDSAPAMRRQHRLRSRSHVGATLRNGNRVTRPEFVLYHFAREAPGEARVALSVGRRLGGAVVRNRVRRVLREALRPLLPRLVAVDVVVVARPGVLGAGGADLEKSLADAAARAGLLLT